MGRKRLLYLTLATSSRMLFGHHLTFKPGMNVLFGALWGIGSTAVQICKAVGASNSIISDDEKIPFVKELGAVELLNRRIIIVLDNFQMSKINLNILIL